MSMSMSISYLTSPACKHFLSRKERAYIPYLHALKQALIQCDDNDRCGIHSIEQATEPERNTGT